MSEMEKLRFDLRCVELGRWALQTDLQQTGYRSGLRSRAAGLSERDAVQAAMPDGVEDCGPVWQEIWLGVRRAYVVGDGDGDDND